MPAPLAALEASTSAVAPVASLPKVDIAENRIIKQVAGLRPFRRSGFVLRAESLGDKTVIHNYGHGGCGITLSWGTANMALRLALETPHGTALMAPGVYAFDRCEVSTRCVLTTTTPVGAFRGAGRPEATAALERAVDLFAAEIGMDPAALRRRNLLPRFTSPFTSLTGAVYDSGDYPAALDRVLAAALFFSIFPVIFYLLIQRYIVAGLSAGAVKG